MDQPPTDRGLEVKRLERCMNDLVSVLALPAVWSGSEPSRILETFLDALLGMVDLDFLYGQVTIDAHEKPIDVLKTSEPHVAGYSRQEIRQALERRLEEGTQRWAGRSSINFGDQKISIFPMQMGVQGELGFILAGSTRAGFPEQTEGLVLSVAANQAAIGLQQAMLLSEQRRVANELDHRVSQRTAELAAANQVLRNQIAERKEIEERLLESEVQLTRSEARHRIVVETASDAVISMDENGLVILANPAIKSIFGYEPEELIGKPLTLLMPESMRKLHESGYKRYLKTGERRLNWGGTEVIARRANGEEFPVEVSFGEMTIGERKMFTGFIRDMTEKKRAEEALRVLEAELTRMTRVMTMGQLTASIAHEVSQPLSGIVTNASTCLRMLNNDPPNLDGARETAQRTIRDGNRAADVITRLRTLYSKKQISIESVDLNEAAQEVLALLLSELQKDGVLLRHQFDENLPRVMGDRVQLQQVILNLLKNASDAMDMVNDRPKQLLIQTETDGDLVRLSVQDCGVGFDPEIAHRLFESFFTTKQEGMGIGLSVSRSIVEAHHGRLWATRNNGPGSTFAFSIPCEHHPQPHSES
jgi:PAS domain S-box-containing protein